MNLFYIQIFNYIFSKTPLPTITPNCIATHTITKFKPIKLSESEIHTITIIVASIVIIIAKSSLSSIYAQCRNIYIPAIIAPAMASCIPKTKIIKTTAKIIQAIKLSEWSVSDHISPIIVVLLSTRFCTNACILVKHFTISLLIRSELNSFRRVTIKLYIIAPKVTEYIAYFLQS